VTTLSPQTLERFVDRTDEMQRFLALLDDPQKFVMNIWGDSGMGKSWLLGKMIHHTSLRGLKKAEIVWGSTRPYDFLGVMRKCRDDLGAPSFPEFTAAANQAAVFEMRLSVEGEVRVAERAQFERSTVRDITGMAVHDNMFVLPPAEATARVERMMALTDIFVREMAQFLSGTVKPVVLFLDSVERMSVETRDWIWDELLCAIYDGRLVGLKVILCGIDEPPHKQDFADGTEDAELRELPFEDVCDYLRLRGINDSVELLAQMLIAAAKSSKPVDVATAVDGYLRSGNRR
jgi:hypothetical protein